MTTNAIRNIVRVIVEISSNPDRRDQLAGMKEIDMKVSRWEFASTA
jgi:hypothetical protein